tara:strand:+ start:6563 stop:7882 length:1320 start_codon:yes stop_codon:yes gene_type:complete
MEIFNKILAIIFSLSILLNAYYIKRVVKTWLVPGVLFSIFWVAYSLPPLIFLFNVPVNPLAILFITLSVILFSWTSALFDWEKAFYLNSKKPLAINLYNKKNLRVTLKLLIALSIFGTVLQVRAQGINIYDMIMHPLVSAGKYAAKRYNQGLNNSNYYIFSLVFAYLSVLLGGLIYGSTNRKKHKRLSLLSFIPSIIIMYTQGVKGLFFLSTFFFLGSLMITKFHDKKLDLFKLKTFFAFFKAFILIFVMMILSFMSRGMQNITSMNVLYVKIKFYMTSYAFTHIYAFSDWFSYYLGSNATQVYEKSNNFFGYYTFRFISKYYMPPEQRDIKGVYEEYFIYEDLIKSNIYTMYRGLIMDFSITGAIIFIALNGLFLHFIFHIFLSLKKPVLSTAIVVFMLAYFYMSYIISLLTWNITILAFILFVLILIFNKYKFVIKK